MYAIIRSGGKQYRVEPGNILEVDRIPGAAETGFAFEEVLLIGDGDTITAGSPLVAGARVTATNLGELRGPKIRVFKFKRKTRYRRTMGHRSELLRLRIEEIELPGQPRKQAAAKPAIEAPAVVEPEVAGAPVATTPAAAARRRRKAVAAEPATEATENAVVGKTPAVTTEADAETAPEAPKKRAPRKKTTTNEETES